MRKSVIPVAVVMLAATNFPALAGKYGCTFLQGNRPINQCDIDSGAGSGRSCDTSYQDGRIMASCSVTNNGATDRLKCFFHTPDKGTDAEKGDVEVTAEPGFLAGGLTLGAPANLVETYRDSGTAPLLTATCQPFRPQ